MDIVVYLVVLFVVVGLWFGAKYGYRSGPDYSSEVEGKVLDISDNRWKTPEQYAKDHPPSV